jgi:hypothetical protein
VIKLTVVSCNSGYNFRTHGNTIANPVVAETTILFHTSGGESVDVVGNTSLIPNRCYGWGWAYSFHACRQLGGVFVCPSGVNRDRFEFWVSLYGYSGVPLVEASAAVGAWQQDSTIQETLPSTGYVPLQVATVLTTMTPGNTSTTNPPILPQL